METKAGKTVFNLKEAAAYLGISVPTLSVLLHEREIPCRRAGQRWLISKAALDDWLTNTGNCLYPNRIEISDLETAKEAFCFDCVFAQYKDNYRSASNFLWSNTLPFGCDNDHSDKPEDWITP